MSPLIAKLTKSRYSGPNTLTRNRCQIPLKTNNIYISRNFSLPVPQRLKVTKINRQKSCIGDLPSLTFLALLRRSACRLSLGPRGLLLTAIVLGLDRKARNEAADTRLILAVLRVLACTDRLGEPGA